jgi:hypothetical protein
MIMNWKGFGRKRSWPYFKVLSRHSPGGTKENHKKSQSGYLVSKHPVVVNQMVININSVLPPM